MGMSIRAYARRRGVSHVAVQKAIKAGRIPTEPDGTIDAGKADAAWTRSTDPARTRVTSAPAPSAPKSTPAAARPPHPVAEPAIGAPQDALKEPGLPGTGPVSFVQARTAHEAAKASLTRLRLQERKRDLVDRRLAATLVFRLAREERDAWITWPARVAATMAAELGVDAHSLQKVLEAQVRAHLAELADVAPDFR